MADNPTPGKKLSPSAAYKLARAGKITYAQAEKYTRSGVPTPGVGRATNPAGDTLGRLIGGKTIYTGKGGAPLGQISVQQLQQKLKQAGYDLTPNGKLDPRTRNALGDYLNPSNKKLSPALATLLGGTAISGRRDPQAWNTRFGDSRRTRMVEKPINQQLDKYGNLLPYDHSGINGQGMESGLPSLQAPGFDPLDPRMFNQGMPNLPNAPHFTPANPNDYQGAQPIDPRLAAMIANGQFAGAINSARDALKMAPRQGAQSLHDVGSWYGQVGKAQTKATARDKAATRAAQASLSGLSGGVLASLGGSANPAASELAGASQNGLNTLTALGNVETQYNNDLAPLLASERAGALSNQRNQNVLDTRKARNELTDLLGKRGSARASTQLQLAEYNNSLRDSSANRALQILQYNNTGAQQNYSNQMSAAEMIANLQSGNASRMLQILGYNQQGQQQQFANQLGIRDQDLQERLGGIQQLTALAQYQRALTPNAGKPMKGSFNQINSIDRHRFVESFGQKITGMEPQEAMTTLANLIRSQGWNFSNPGVRNFANSVLNLAGVQSTIPTR